jgi:hypothetical protein
MTAQDDGVAGDPRTTAGLIALLWADPDYLNRTALGESCGGRGGGGALRVWSDTRITINGRVLANGGDGGDAYIGTHHAADCQPQPGAAGFPPRSDDHGDVRRAGFCGGRSGRCGESLCKGGSGRVVPGACG